VKKKERQEILISMHNIEKVIKKSKKVFENDGLHRTSLRYYKYNTRSRREMIEKNT
jgi:hypothetical protein